MSCIGWDQLGVNRLWREKDICKIYVSYVWSENASIVNMRHLLVHGCVSALWRSASTAKKENASLISSDQEKAENYFLISPMENHVNRQHVFTFHLEWRGLERTVFSEIFSLTFSFRSSTCPRQNCYKRHASGCNSNCFIGETPVVAYWMFVSYVCRSIE